MCIPNYVEAARAAWSRGHAPTYDEDAVTDLLADIRHFCAVAGHNFEQCSRLAAMHFDHEHGGAS